MTLVPADPARSIRSATGRRQNRVPHPCRGFWRQGGVFDFLDSRENPEVKIPTLSLQKPEGQGWGTPSSLDSAKCHFLHGTRGNTPKPCHPDERARGRRDRTTAGCVPVVDGEPLFPPTASRHPQSYGPSFGFRRTQGDRMTTCGGASSNPYNSTDCRRLTA